MPEPVQCGGYLAKWWRELHNGQRGVNDYDTLWRAACWEAFAFEAPPGSEAWRKGIDRANDMMLRQEGPR